MTIIVSIDKEANAFGMSPFAIDEQVFAQGKVRCVGQIIGVVAAEDQEVARLGATKVDHAGRGCRRVLKCTCQVDGFAKEWCPACALRQVRAERLASGAPAGLVHAPPIGGGLP